MTSMFPCAIDMENTSAFLFLSRTDDFEAELLGLYFLLSIGLQGITLFSYILRNFVNLQVDK